MKHYYLLLIISLLLLGSCQSSEQTNSQSQATSLSEQSNTQEWSKVNNCHVYIENSGSMDGYVRPADSQMRSDLNALVSGISTLGLNSSGSTSVDTISLYYINSQIIPIEKSISRFTEGLSVQSFRSQGGNRMNTSLEELLERIMTNTPKEEVSILVSDMILDLQSGQSPESVSTNIETHLRRLMATRKEWSIVAWRMLSDYDGRYYHATGYKPIDIKTTRPYWIFFFGDRAQLRSLLAEGRLPDNLPLLKRRTHTLSLEPKVNNPNYSLMRQAVQGSITLDKKDKSRRNIAKADTETNSRGEKGISFEIRLDNPLLLQGQSALLDTDQWSVEPNRWRIQSLREAQDGQLRLRIGAERVYPGKISISLTPTEPKWIEEVDSPQNTDILASAELIERTYGIAHILRGLQRPYQSQASKLITLEININK